MTNGQITRAIRLLLGEARRRIAEPLKKSQNAAVGVYATLQSGRLSLHATYFVDGAWLITASPESERTLRGCVNEVKQNLIKRQ